MEPAGSHGVHSLDDFQFLCFLFGSVQMGCQNELQPSDFAIAPTVEKYADKYMFLQAIQHINRVKTGPFSEHSYTLWGVSGCQLWDKVSHFTGKPSIMSYLGSKWYDENVQSRSLRKIPCHATFLFRFNTHT